LDEWASPIPPPIESAPLLQPPEEISVLEGGMNRDSDRSIEAPVFDDIIKIMIS
jgi:hypothetical protein